MAKACSSMFLPFEHSLKGPDHASKEALTYALLETVRLVLEGQDSEEDEKQPHVQDPNNSSENNSTDVYADAVPAMVRKKPPPKPGVLGGPCAHCGATESPQWRRPLTKKVVLCNACGIYYSRHHSLPKRKKALGAKQASDDTDKEAESYGHPDSTMLARRTVETDNMVCDAPIKADSVLSEGCNAMHLKPIATTRESISSADCMQYEEAKPSQTPTNSISMACASPAPANSMSMACMSPATSCGSPVHHSSGIAAPPTTPKKRTDDQIDALFDAHEESLAKRAMKRAAAAAMTAAASHQLSHVAASCTPAVSTGTSTPAQDATDNFMGALPSARRPVITASLAASMGMQLPPAMHQQRHSAPLQPPRMSILEALMHQQSQSRMANPMVNSIHAFAALPGILMTTGNPGFQQHPPSFSNLKPVASFSEQSADSDAGMILMPVSTCRGPQSKPSSRQGSPVCGSRHRK